jgi:hypothetical protein
LALLADRGYNARRDRVKTIVLILVEEANPLISPAYDEGATESTIAARWEHHFDELTQRRPAETRTAAATSASARS